MTALDLSGKTVVVTGALGGIGSATARRFVWAGANVVGCDIRADGGALAATLTGIGGGAFRYVPADVSTGEGARAVAAVVRETWGHLDVLLNVAGAMVTAHVSDMTEEEWDLTLNAGPRGVFLMVRELIGLMGPGGSIVNIASALGLVGQRKTVAYSAAKGAVVNMTRSLAADLAPDIRVNVICPGGVDTPMPRLSMIDRSQEEKDGHWKGLQAKHLLGRVAEPDEIVNAMLFLASDAASFMTGSVMTVDGGWTTT